MDQVRDEHYWAIEEKELREKPCLLIILCKRNRSCLTNTAVSHMPNDLCRNYVWLRYENRYQGSALVETSKARIT